MSRCSIPRLGHARVLGGVTVAILLTLVAPPETLAGQAPGLPTFTDPFRTPVSRGPDFQGRFVFGGPDHAGLLALRHRPFEKFTMQAVGGAYRPRDMNGDRTAKLHGGAAVDYQLWIPDPIALTAHAGVGYRATDGGNVLTIPLGIGVTAAFIPIAESIPGIRSAGGAKVGPWAMPRVERLRRSGPDATQSDWTWGVSFGLGAFQSAGLGIGVGWDYRSVPDAAPALGLPNVAKWSWAVMISTSFGPTR